MVKSKLLNERTKDMQYGPWLYFTLYPAHRRQVDVPGSEGFQSFSNYMRDGTNQSTIATTCVPLFSPTNANL